ncbi:unnamed protein product [Strongylus vulgaris]|uniref:RRM domain-containing protein n=1 Tax=Strongylus vulgaris TaxID=40348 RepID=A0A3P7HZB9_STRVU|nr:unnamed protein product [Strongylus vulgaris]
MVHDRETDKFKGFAYVEFNSADELRKVLEINGVDYGGRPLKIDVASQRPGDRGGRGRDRGERGGRGGSGWNSVDHNRNRGGFRGNYGGRQRRRNSERNHEEEEFVEHPDRPHLVLKPRTTDPAELEAKRQREAEEEAARRAKLFIA